MLTYTYIPKTMIEADFLSATEFRICAVLHSYSFFDNVFPSIAEIKAKARVAESTVFRAIQKFEELGFITKKSRFKADGGQSSNEYIFNYGGWDAWYSNKFGSNDKQQYIGEKVKLVKISDDTQISVYENKILATKCFNDFLYTDKLDASEIRTFLYLKQFSNRKEVYSSYKMLSAKVNISKPIIIRTMNSLSEKSLVMKLNDEEITNVSGTTKYLILNDLELENWVKNSKDS